MLTEHEFEVSVRLSRDDVFAALEQAVCTRIPANTIPLRLAIPESNESWCRCEVGTIEAEEMPNGRSLDSIFEFVPRSLRREESFNTALVVPTGVGAEIGGHSGDATPIARLLAECSDRLITHPNVVNAADINEMAPNTLYVEGSVISRLLMGVAGLAPVRSNRILLISEAHDDELFSNAAINSANAARTSGGIDIRKFVLMDPPIRMRTHYSQSGRATGTVDGFADLCEILDELRAEYDAVALTSVVDMPRSVTNEYFHTSGENINPYGGVEAILTHAVSSLYDVPSAHSPMYEDRETCDEELGIMDPRIASEGVSLTTLHCLFKGLHRSPRIVSKPEELLEHGVLTAADISCLVIPDGCIGIPTLAAARQGIPIIAVRENRNVMSNDLTVLGIPPDQLYVVDNYLEAAGVLTALRAGVAPPTLRRGSDLAVSIVSPEGAGALTAKASH